MGQLICYDSLPRKWVTKVGLISLDRLKNISVEIVPLVVILDAWHGSFTKTSIHIIQKMQEPAGNSEIN